MTTDTAHLPVAIVEFVRATNSADSEAFIATFTGDATLNDWGRKFAGRAQIAQWDRTDNIGVHSQLCIVDARAGSETGTYETTMRVRGDGYNGEGTMIFTIHDERITDLTIR